MDACVMEILPSDWLLETETNKIFKKGQEKYE